VAGRRGIVRFSKTENVVSELVVEQGKEQNKIKKAKGMQASKQIDNMKVAPQDNLTTRQFGNAFLTPTSPVIRA
jgi:hypothetical protein